MFLVGGPIVSLIEHTVMHVFYTWWYIITYSRLILCLGTDAVSAYAYSTKKRSQA